MTTATHAIRCGKRRHMRQSERWRVFVDALDNVNETICGLSGNPEEAASLPRTSRGHDGLLLGISIYVTDEAHRADYYTLLLESGKFRIVSRSKRRVDHEWSVPLTVVEELARRREPARQPHGPGVHSLESACL